MLNSQQCRAARALLDWTQSELAEHVSISAVSLRAFEKGGDMRESNRKLLRLTFESAGVTFLDAGAASAGGGAGVRLTAEGTAPAGAVEGNGDDSQ